MLSTAVGHDQFTQTQNEMLARALNKKAVGIVLPGASLTQQISSVRHEIQKNVVWVGLNKFRALENQLWQKDEPRIQIGWISAIDRVRNQAAEIASQISRGDIIVTNQEGMDAILEPGAPQPINLVKDPLGNQYYETENHGRHGTNSLTAFIFWLCLYQPDAIFIFGCDGHPATANSVYQNQYTEYPEEDYIERRRTISRDTEMMNRGFWRLHSQLQLPIVDIYNVNPNSTLETFPRIDGHQASDLLVQIIE